MSDISEIAGREAAWDQRFLSLALSIGGWSKDRSRRVGAIIVDEGRSILAVGYNGFPRGVDESSNERHERPEKYLWTEHAERNAIYDAARRGVSLDRSTMYLPWYPCADCARAIIQAGVATLVALRSESRDPIWDEHFRVSSLMLEEAEINVRLWNRSDLS